MFRNCILLVILVILYIVSIEAGGKFSLRPLRAFRAGTTKRSVQSAVKAEKIRLRSPRHWDLRGGSNDREKVPIEVDGHMGGKSSNEKYNMDFIYFATKHALSSVLKDPDALRIVSRILSTIVWAYMVLSAVGTLGFDTKPLLSLLGIGGLTVGFSVKDMLADSFAGLFVLFTRPFQRGDVVTINGSKGRVVSMDMRYVKLYNANEGAEVLIPVSSVYKSEIKIERPALS